MKFIFSIGEKKKKKEGRNRCQNSAGRKYVLKELVL
jgi:hypothetical protein